MRKLLLILICSVVGLMPILGVQAQTAAYAELASIDASDFPRITALVDVYGADGEFVNGLQPSHFSIYEDGEQYSANRLDELAVPAQIVVAINPGPALAVRDGNAVPRFDYVVDILGRWANAQPADSQDDLSLVSLSGSLISHANARDWFVSLSSFKPDFRSTTPNLQTLAIALDTVTAPSPQPGMKRSILLITPHMDDADIESVIAPLLKRAVDSKVRVLVWFVDAQNYSGTPSANAFTSLAQQTSGSFFAFSGIEPFPDLNASFAPLRHIYKLTYSSALATTGTHSLGLYVEAPAGRIPALDKSFNVDIEPPNPILVSPPLQITRQPSEADPYNRETIGPNEQSLEILVEFPDGHPRALERTALYVDGVLVQENETEPFEHFVWDLSGYDSSGQHQLMVEAEDTLGLKKSSLGLPVDITVVQPPQGWRAMLARYRSYIVLGAIGLAGLALLAIILRGRSAGPSRRERVATRKRFEDPLTQPVKALTEAPIPATKKQKIKPRRGGWLPPRPARVAAAPAYLIPLVNGGEPASVSPIPVADKDMTFGTDPVQSKRVLDDASISPLHARIRQMDDGSFFIYDHGSVAGTWVNYEPVLREGCPLAHGDRIHFGQLMYRFDLSPHPALAEPKVTLRKSNSS